MPFITAEHLASAIQRTRAMNLSAKEKICDEIFEQQPILLSSVLALTKSDVEGRYLDMLLDLLIAMHLSLKGAGIRLAPVTVDEHETQITRFAAVIKFTAGLTPEQVEQSIKLYEGFKREPWLLAHVTSTVMSSGVLVDSKPTGNQIVLSTYGLVGSIAGARQLSN